MSLVARRGSILSRRPSRNRETGSKDRPASGLGPLLGTFRALDLLHCYVLDLEVEVDFLGIYAKRATEALREAGLTTR